MNINNNAGRGNAQQPNNNQDRNNRENPPRIMHRIPMEYENNEPTYEVMYIRSLENSLRNHSRTIEHQNRMIESKNRHIAHQDNQIMDLNDYINQVHAILDTNTEVISGLNAELEVVTKRLKKLQQFEPKGELQYLIIDLLKDNVNIPDKKNVIIHALECSQKAGHKMIGIINDTQQAEPLTDRIQEYLTRSVTEEDVDMIHTHISVALENHELSIKKQRTK